MKKSRLTTNLIKYLLIFRDIPKKKLLKPFEVSKKLFKIKNTKVLWWKIWSSCTIFSSPYQGIFDFEQFFWNLWWFQQFFLGKILKHYLLKFDGFMGKFWPKITNEWFHRKHAHVLFYFCWRYSVKLGQKNDGIHVLLWR